MNLFKIVAGSGIAWCVCVAVGAGQQNGAATSTAPTETPSSISSDPVMPNGGTGKSSTNSMSAPTAAIPNPPATAGIPPAAGTAPLSGAQPGQTGSMESQRLNALNQAYENEQRATLQRNQQANQSQVQRDFGRLGPARSVPGSLPLRAGAGMPIDSSIDRNVIVGDLQRFGQPVEDWRIVNQQGRWWYWKPDNSWQYYNHGNWTAYRGKQDDGGQITDHRGVNVPPGYPAEDWRLVRHNNRWWFWTPNESWMYFRNGRWNDYRAAGSTTGLSGEGEPYSAGYRGAAEFDNAQSVEPAGDGVRIHDEEK